MPRMPYDAKEKIINGLKEGPKSWKELLKTTGLSKAALSTNLNNFLDNSVVCTEVDANKRPPKTIYKINSKMLSSWRTLQPIRSAKKEISKSPWDEHLGRIGDWVMQHPKKLDELLRLEVISWLCHESSAGLAVSTDEDVDIESRDYDEPPTLPSDVEEICIGRVFRYVKRSFEESYGINIPTQKIEKEIERMKQEGFFTVGRKNLYGIRISKKMESSDTVGYGSTALINYYRKIEAEIKESK